MEASKIPHILPQKSTVHNKVSFVFIQLMFLFAPKLSKIFVNDNLWPSFFNYFALLNPEKRGQSVLIPSG